MRHKRFSHLWLLLGATLLTLLLGGCKGEIFGSPTDAADELEARAGNSLQIGVDLSEALYAQEHGVQYRDTNGQVKDVFQIFKDHGYTWVRVRVNVDPPDNPNYAMFTDLAYAKQLGAIAKSKGFKLLVDFHYSHWWADPGNQWTPSAWQTNNINTLCTYVYNWTKDAITQLRNAGAAPDMVQIGNEITNGLLWDLGGPYRSGGSWRNMAWLINSGINGVKDAGSSAKIMIHLDSGGSRSTTQNWITNFRNNDGQWWDVDAFGLSYYTMWQGSLGDLSNNLSYLNTLGKEIYIVETAYYWDTNEKGYSGSQVPYPQTPQGQYQFLQALKNTVSAYSNVKGVFYWGAAWAQSWKWLSAPGWPDDDASRRSLFDDNAVATMGIDGLF
ncbi:glycosyl hydrolase 53 family protein [Spirochaeta thermophila]|uniref:Arabinogalactan endo-beta-1,4-galactanase n=1 Tax=Winmispira thermophila (strain ATCC 49972 / DSM 6192 / RI 19.B1) TaxID=665571 RepID=E0RPQ3_WINT6|nr:glycosyl hydrolase 53 family protein [Spirochaeta thermophila]ADN01367.1 arabinogalactan endo-1,4-beta-galactosidase [Spirochaeta thermophila DSM 6192]